MKRDEENWKIENRWGGIRRERKEKMKNFGIWVIKRRKIYRISKKKSFFSLCRLFNEFGNSSRRCGRNFQRNEKVIYYYLFLFISLRIMIFKIFLDVIQSIFHFYLFLLFFSYSNIQIVDFFCLYTIFSFFFLLYVFHFKIFDVTYILFPYSRPFDFFLQF